jgi:DNA-binding NtrC family response regulator
LVWFFLSRRKLSLEGQIESVPDDVMRSLERYPWPGNVRELANVVERAVILAEGSSLRLDPAFGRGRVGGASSPETPDTAPTRLADVERSHIVSVLKACDWRVKGRWNAAEQLGLHPSTLQHRMKKLGIERPSS